MSENAKSPSQPQNAEEVANLAGERIAAARRDALGEDPSPEEELAFAETLLGHAMIYADEAFLSAADAGVDLRVRDAEPEPIRLRARRVRAPGGKSLERAVALARKDLGLADGATTADVAQAVDGRSTPKLERAHKAIQSTVEAAREAETAAAEVPVMRTVVWLLSAAADIGSLAIARRQGGYAYGRAFPHPILRAFETVQSADPEIDRRRALELILSAVDQSETGEWRALIDKAEEKLTAEFERWEDTRPRPRGSE